MLLHLGREKWRLVDAAQFNVEYQCCVAGNGWWGAFGAVCGIWWASDTSLWANFHANNTDVPSGNDFTFAQGEFESFARLCAVEHFVVRLQATFVVDDHLFSGLGFRSFAYGQIVNNHTTSQGFWSRFLWLLLVLLAFLLLLLLKIKCMD